MYKDFSFDIDILQKYQEDAMEAVNTAYEHNIDESDNVVDESDNDVDAKEEPRSGVSASIIVDKYMEDSKAPTVANKLADMIIQFETNAEPNTQSEEYLNQPEDHMYNEDCDELDNLDDDDDVDDDDENIEVVIESLSDKDIEKLDQLHNLTRDIKRFKNVNLSELCKCSLSNIGGIISELLYNTKKINPDDDSLKQMKVKIENKLTPLIDQFRQHMKEKDDCNHDFDSDLSKFIHSVVIDKSNKPEELVKYIERQNEKIQDKLHKLSVAPAEEGKWKNWGADLYLEEKLFPALFPYGWGGFLSTNFLRDNNMGFANYVKSRLLSVNPKFRKDPYYVFMLLLVKEMVDIQRSQRTVLRKATKVPNLNKEILHETSLEFLMRNNNATF